MGLRINQNIAALTAARTLQARQKALAKSIQRLSTGKRINSAADDPAGSIVSENLRVQAGGIDRDIQNKRSSVNRLRTEDAKLGGAFEQLRSIRNRALDALNSGASGPAARAANQVSARSSVDSVTRTLTGIDTTGEGVDSSGLSGIAQSLAGIDLSTESGARDALAAVDSAIENLSTFRSEVGSFQSNNLESGIRSQEVAVENLRASESAIRDTDFAQATVDFVRTRLQFEANVALLARANNASKSILDLFDSSGGSSGPRRYLGTA